MNRFRSTSFVLIPVFCFFAVLLNSPAARALGPQFDAFVGYSSVGNKPFTSGARNGVQGAFNYQLKHFVGIEGDVAQYGLQTSGTHYTSMLFGPRVTVGALGVHLFAHGLVGAEHDYNNSAAIGAIGGGVDLPVAPFFAVRVGADYLVDPKQLSTAGTARISTGMVFRF